MIDHKTCILQAQMPEHKYLVQQTKRFILRTLQQVQKPYVACSFGKDSAVMLHLIMQIQPTIPVIFVSRIETNLVDNYAEIIQQWGNINLTEVQFEGDTFSYINKSVIKTGMLQIQHNYDSYFCGLRAEESVGRRITLRMHGKYYLKKDGLVRICPVAFWKEKDIAAYTVANKLPILNTYIHEGFAARTTAGVSSKTPHLTIQSLKTRNIEAYNKLLEILPESKFFT